MRIPKSDNLCRELISQPEKPVALYPVHIALQAIVRFVLPGERDRVATRGDCIRFVH